jgi:hypothetical protein
MHRQKQSQKNWQVYVSERQLSGANIDSGISVSQAIGITEVPISALEIFYLANMARCDFDQPCANNSPTRE